MGEDIALEEHSLLREADPEDVAPITRPDEIHHDNIQSSELEPQTHTAPRKRVWISQRIWQLSTIFFALLSLFLYIRPKLEDDEMPKKRRVVLCNMCRFISLAPRTLLMMAKHFLFQILTNLNMSATQLLRWIALGMNLFLADISILPQRRP
ncbi:hypothetical protein DH86_00003588, partial [Scytalidium sp. 3C]